MEDGERIRKKATNEIMRKDAVQEKKQEKNEEEEEVEGE